MQNQDMNVRIVTKIYCIDDGAIIELQVRLKDLNWTTIRTTFVANKKLVKTEAMEELNKLRWLAMQDKIIQLDEQIHEFEIYPPEQLK